MTIKKAMWLVRLPCGQKFPMVGAVKTYEEALAYAKKIWPAATVE